MTTRKRTKDNEYNDTTQRRTDNTMTTRKRTKQIYIQ